jgi:rubrerythrin
MAMTPRQIIDLVVSFEKDLATFYEDLQLKASLKPLEKICRFMAQHSAIHAELIANYRSNADVPQLEINPLGTLHDRLKTSLRKELIATDDVNEAARKLSQAEEIVSQAYAKIADHFDQVADTYRMIASKFNSLADDERTHRDYILQQNERLNTTGTALPPDSGR